MDERFFTEARGFALSGDAIKTGRVGGNAIAKKSAEQLGDRHAVMFAGDVPQGNIHGADGRDHGAFAAVVAGLVIHLVPQHFRRERVGADQQRLQRKFNGGGRNLRRFQALVERFAPADDAIVRGDFDDGR